MSPKQLITALVAAHAIALSPAAHPQTSGISVSIDKHARLTSSGAIVVRLRIACGPFEGTEDFQESFAGASQEQSGAEAEGGVDGTVVCDGVQRVQSARLASFNDFSFRRGPANANAGVMVCVLVLDEQMCFSGGASRRVIVRGRAIP
jgi:hypothetical protein